jgi:hypothetical protein
MHNKHDQNPSREIVRAVPALIPNEKNGEHPSHKIHTSYNFIAHLHLNTLGIYSWSEIQLIPILEGEVERISQHPPTTQTNPQTLVCNINETLSLIGIP